jgi:hypothetical protein
MEQEFYSAIKLITGEEIFSLVSVDENNGDPILILQNPVIMKMIHNQHGMYVKIKPWMDLPDDDFYIIRYDKIVTMTEIKNPLMIEYYNKFMNDEDDSDLMGNGKESNEVKLSDKMGYVSSVEEARKNLENLYKNL